MSQDQPQDDLPYGQTPSAPPPPPPSYQPAYGGARPMSPSDERLWATLAHLSWIAGSIIAIAPLGPLVVFLIFKDRSPFVRRASVEALNFWITVYIGLAISIALMLVIVGFFTFPLILLAALILSILAAVAANRGEDYRYPFTLRLVH